jgi:NADH:ubiquinone oxidoreductase subunit F (NADH-binding)/ferredoxin
MQAAPELFRVGPARVTAGLDRYPRLDIASHRDIFGPPPTLRADELIRICDQVDLRGRGGAAFPLARKLQAVQKVASAGRRRPFIVVNATEGEPGSSKDKMLLARTPFLVLDGALIAATALNARKVVIAISGKGPHASSISQAVAADSRISRLVRVVSVPDRFVSGEGGALVNAINGKRALPPGRKVLPSDSGVNGLPTLLSNAETFAQLAVLAYLGPERYASTGAPDQAGTVLLTVGGSVERPAVVEVPAGLPLGAILDICQAKPAHGVLVGGYHGMWLTPDIAYEVPVSRTGLAAAGGTLGAGVVLVLGEETCPLSEVARVAGYLAAQSSGQCGPCKLGLPAVAKSLAAITAGSGGLDQVEAVRRTAGAIRGRGACAHPDGVGRFVTSALDVFAQDLGEHLFRGSCGNKGLGILPLPEGHGEAKLSVDWTRCQGHGLCARVLPELIQLDENGYPEFLDAPVPFWLNQDAKHAVDICPSLALRLDRTKPKPASAPSPGRAAVAASPRKPVPVVTSQRQRMRALPPPARSEADLDVTSEWIAELGGRSTGQVNPLRS